NGYALRIRRHDRVPNDGGWHDSDHLRSCADAHDLDRRLYRGDQRPVIRLTKTHLQPIGLDIGFDSIKMMQLETCGDSLSVHVAARLPIPAEARATMDVRMPVAIDMIRHMFRQNGFSGRRVVTSL